MIFPDIHVLLLAAGLSRRMGAVNKLLIEVEGQSLIRRTAKLYCDLGMQVTAILGHEAETVADALEGLNLQTVYNPDYASGQQSSVRAGLMATNLEGDALLVALGDQVLLERADLAAYCATFLKSARDRIMIPYFDGARGNPVLFPATVARRLQADGKAPGCRKFIDDNPQLVVQYDAPNTHFTTDLDTQEDVKRLLGTSGN